MISRCRQMICGLYLVGLLLSRPVDAQNFEPLAVHPDAAAQTTELGRTLHTLHAVGTQIFVGYGDWSFDTGPINIRAFDTQAATFGSVLVIGNTESFARFVTVGDTVFAPHTDPRTFTPGGYVFGSAAGNAPWSEFASLTALHLFDFAALDSQHFFLVGSGGPTNIFNSIAYESLDAGATWQLALDLPVPASEPSSFAFTRFYGAGQLNGQLYIQQILFNSSSVPGGGNEPLSFFRYDGTSWTDIGRFRTSDNKVTQFLDPDTFAGRIVVRDRQAGQGLSPMFEFDGSELREILLPGISGQTSAWDHVIHNNGLYVLTDERTVLFTADLAHWETLITEVPAVARSLTVTSDSVWFGGTDSAIYRYALVPEPSGLFALTLVAFLISCRRRTIY